jgi:hypothetical protein
MTVAAVLLVLLVAVLVGANAALTGGGTPSSGPRDNHPTSTPPPAPPPIRVSAERQVTFTDNCPTCSTENFVTGSSTNGRTLVTDLWYPSRDGTTPATVNGTAPLILFAHGFDLLPTDYLPLIDAWVLHGFVVAAPVFPDTNATAVAPVLHVYPNPQADDPHGNPENDSANEPGDLGFVLEQLVADAAPGSSGGAQAANAFLAGLFNPSEVALAGQSDGGDVAAALGYNSCCSAGPAATRIKAIAVLSGAENSGWFTGSWFATQGPPLLVAQGTADACNNPTLSTALYDAAPAAGGKYFVTLLGADHLSGYAAPGPTTAATAAVTAAFFDLYLHHGQATPESVIAAGTTSVSQTTDSPTAPALKAVTPTWSYNIGSSQDPCSVTFAGPPGTTTTTAGG